MDSGRQVEDIVYEEEVNWLFIFSSDTLTKYGFSEIRSGYRILKRYDLSRQDLERLSYLVQYP